MRRSDRERLEDIAEALEAVRVHIAARAGRSERLKRDAVLYTGGRSPGCAIC